MAILVEFKDLSDLFIPTAPSRINKGNGNPVTTQYPLSVAFVLWEGRGGGELVLLRVQ